MPRGQRIRRKHEDLVTTALQLAEKKPITPQDLAREVGFGPNRARQVLEGLRKSRKLAALGKRRSARGKPAVLYGTPGTKVTARDMAPRKGRSGPAARPTGGVARGEGRAPSGPSAGAVLGEFLGALASRGLEIAGPAGISFTVRLGVGGSVEQPKAKRKTARRARKAAAIKRTSRPARKPAPAPTKAPAKKPRRLPARAKASPVKKAGPAKSPSVKRKPAKAVAPVGKATTPTTEPTPTPPPEAPAPGG